MIFVITIGLIILFFDFSKGDFIYDHVRNTDGAAIYFSMLYGFGLTYSFI